MKKMLVLLLALLALATTAAMAEGMFEFDELESGAYGVVGYNGPGGEVVVPAEYCGSPVVFMRETFKDNTTITGVIIPEGVESIFFDTFAGCTNLTKVHLPSTLLGMEASAFDGCVNLTDVNLSDVACEIHADTFADCVNLTAEIPQSPEAPVPAEFVEIGGFLNGSLAELMDLVGPMEMSDESWALYDGATYLNDAMSAFTMDDETILGLSVRGGNYALKGVNCHMTPDEIKDVLTAQGYTVKYFEENNAAFVNGIGEEEISINYDGDTVYVIVIGANG